MVNKCPMTFTQQIPPTLLSFLFTYGTKACDISLGDTGDRKVKSTLKIKRTRRHRFIHPDETRDPVFGISWNEFRRNLLPTRTFSLRPPSVFCPPRLANQARKMVNSAPTRDIHEFVNRKHIPVANRSILGRWWNTSDRIAREFKKCVVEQLTNWSSWLFVSIDCRRL